MSEEENPSEEQEKVVEESDSSEDLLEDWPFSNNFILAAILLLIASAFTLAFRTEEQANQYAIWAYYALVIGVLLRFVEIILDERFDTELKAYTYAKLEPLTSKVKKQVLNVSKMITDKFKTEGSGEDHTDFEEPSKFYSVLSYIKEGTGKFLPDPDRYKIVREYYVCEVCEARFQSVASLRSHKKEDHD